MDRFLFDYLLRVGDTALVLSQRLSQWCGHGPALAEDLAMTNVSLDLLGQARLWLTLAGELEGRGRGADELAYLRVAHVFRHYHVEERATGDSGGQKGRPYFFCAWPYLLKSP